MDVLDILDEQTHRMLLMTATGNALWEQGMLAGVPQKYLDDWIEYRDMVWGDPPHPVTGIIKGQPSVLKSDGVYTYRSITKPFEADHMNCDT